LADVIRRDRGMVEPGGSGGNLNSDMTWGRSRSKAFKKTVRAATTRYG